MPSCRVLIPAIFAGLFAAPLAAQSIAYPDARRVRASDVLHGVEIADPYRWMESGSSRETRDWALAQDNLFLRYAQGADGYERLLQRVADIGDFDSVSPPVVESGRWFFTRRPSGEGRTLLIVRDENEKERTLLDPRTYFDSDLDRWAGFTASPDGRLIAVGVDGGAGTWGSIHIIDVESGETLEERLIGASGPFGFPGVFWTSDSSAFVYFHTDVRGPNGDESIALRNNKVRLHRVGTPQTEDPVVFARPDRPDMFVNTLALSTDDRYVVTSITEKASQRTLHYAIDITNPGARPIELADDDGRLTHVGNDSALQLYLTDIDAPNGRVVAIDPAAPDRKSWAEVIPESDATLTSVTVSRDYLVARCDIDAKPTLRIYSLGGEHVSDASLPGIGGVGVSASRYNNEIYVIFSVLTDPGSVYKLEPTTGESELVYRPKLAFNPDDYVVKQVFYPSFDGTRVPMFIAHRKDLDFTSARPVWMYGFGASGWVAFPWFQRHLVAWLEMGGVYALPGIRGGGEYGAAWREAGEKRNKPTTIGDYIAAGEWLVEEGYTSPKLLVANGGSASGPLPAMAVNKRPDLFGAAVVDFPFLDMMRYHLFANGFTRSYGDPMDPGDFEALRGYSPYHNIREGECYPPVLVTVAEKDTSTAPFHGYKHVAALQHAQPCENPIMLQVIWNTGHYSYGATHEQADANYTNQIAFLIRALGLDEAR